MASDPRAWAGAYVALFRYLKWKKRLSRLLKMNPPAGNQKQRERAPRRAVTVSRSGSSSSHEMQCSKTCQRLVGPTRKRQNKKKKTNTETKTQNTHTRAV